MVWLFIVILITKALLRKGHTLLRAKPAQPH
jgi:hypothetical protein